VTSPGPVSTQVSPHVTWCLQRSVSFRTAKDAEAVCLVEGVAVPDYGSPYEISRMAELHRLIPTGPGLAVEIGCNRGVTTGLLGEHGWTSIGYDIAEDVIAEGSAGVADVDLRVGDVRTALEQVGQADLVVSLEVIEHMKEEAQARFVVDLARLTKPGGALLLSTPGRHSFWSYLERIRNLPRQRWSSYNWWDDSHKHVLSLREVRALLTANGFSVEHTVGFYYLPYEVVRPFAIRRGPLAGAGFDLMFLARRRRP